MKFFPYWRNDQCPNRNRRHYPGWVSLATENGVSPHAGWRRNARGPLRDRRTLWVLAHGGQFKKESWKPQAEAMAAVGLRCIAIEYRSDDDNQGPLDVLSAVHYLRQTGATSVSVVGASMGGDYAAAAAEMEPDAIDRLVLLAAGAYTPLVRMKGRKLFLLARDDANTAGPRLPRIRAQYEKASEPKRLLVVDGSAHAQFLFQTNQGQRVMREILNFLTQP